MGTPEKFSNNCFENGMVRHLNNFLISTHISLRNLWGGTLKYLYSEGKLIQYTEVNYLVPCLKDNCFIDPKELFLHALL